MSTATAIPLSEKLTLRVREAERLTGLCRDYVYGAIRDGSLPAIRLAESGPYQIRRADLDAWLARLAQRQS
jgi:excisionase family DNA binding protein